MKFEKNEKYNTYVLFALIVAAFAGVLISLAVHFDRLQAFLSKLFSAFVPLLYAAIIMLILLPVVNFFDEKFRRLFRKRKHGEKIASVLALVCAYLLLLAVILLAVGTIIPQFSVLYGFALTSKDYLTELDAIGTSLAEKYDLFGESLLKLFAQLKSSIISSLTGLTAYVPAIVAAFGNAVSKASDWILGLIISVYALMRRDHLKALAYKLSVAFFPKRAAARISAAVRTLYNNSVWFLSARAYNSLVLGVVFYFLFSLMGLKFHSVLCLLVALCNFVPIFGMLIGGILGALIVLVTDTKLTVWFLAVYLAVTVLGYIFVRPRITNKNVRLTVGGNMLCVLIGYFVFRILGAIFAVPIYATVRDRVRAAGEAKAKETQKKVKNGPDLTEDR